MASQWRIPVNNSFCIGWCLQTLPDRCGILFGFQVQFLLFNRSCIVHGEKIHIDWCHWAACCQGMSETRNVSHPSAHGTPMDLQNRCSRGWVPAECLEQKMLYAYATVCTQGDFTLSRKWEESCLLILPKSYYIYNKRVTQRAGAKQVRHGYPLSSMKMHQANAAYGEKDK